MKYCELLSQDVQPYEFALGLEKGASFPGKPPYPEIVVLLNNTVRVRELQWQHLLVRASSPEVDRTEDVQIMRLVAVLEGGTEIEMQREAIPADVLELVEADPSRCAACTRPIPPGGAVVDENGRHYHRNTCWRE
jgi:hypothetical protein